MIRNFGGFCEQGCSCDAAQIERWEGGKAVSLLSFKNKKMKGFLFESKRRRVRE
jgi:hypothetical protein